MRKAAEDEAKHPEKWLSHMNGKGAQEEDENYKDDLGSRFNATLTATGPQATGHSAGDVVAGGRDRSIK